MEKKSQDLGPLREMTLGNFEPDGCAVTNKQRESLRKAVASVRSYISQPSGWLLIRGGYGCGKTHLAAAIANGCLSAGVPLLFVNVPDLLDYLRGAYNPNVEETFDDRFNEVRDAEILILDDLGTQNATPWAEEKLYQILNARYVAKRPTVITTNLDLDELDPRLYSRLSDRILVEEVEILAPDFRRKADAFEKGSINSLGFYQDKTFERFNVNAPDLSQDERDNIKVAKELVFSYAQSPTDWLALIGKSGVGKTHLAAAVANLQASQGHPAMFVVVPDLLDYLRAAFSPDSRIPFDQRFEEVRTAPLLVLDDLGTESATPWAREKLYQIINYRYVARLPTVITTSSSPDDLDSRIRTRILDRRRCQVFQIRVPPHLGERENDVEQQQKPEYKQKSPKTFKARK
jgi:DNA replication protein DnaC